MNADLVKTGRLRSLIGTIWIHYREFLAHPEYRGSRFNWLVPLNLAVANWEGLR